MSSAGIEDYRVYADPVKKRVTIVFHSGEGQVSVNVHAADAQKLIAALTRAVQQLDSLESRH